MGDVDGVGFRGLFIAVWLASRYIAHYDYGQVFNCYPSAKRRVEEAITRLLCVKETKRERNKTCARAQKHRNFKFIFERFSGIT